VTAIPLAVGAVALLNTASGAGKMPRARVVPGAFPPSHRLEGRSLATRQPARSYGPATRWRLDDLVTALLQCRAWTMSRSSLWRMLEAAALTPPRRVYGRNSHAPDCESTAHHMCSLDSNARRFFAPGRLVICPDEQTGRQMLERTYATPPMAPGNPAKRAQEYRRHGTRVLLASCVVPTGQVVWHLAQTRTSTDCAAPVAHVVTQRPKRKHDHWVVDHLTTPWSLAVCRVVAQWCQVPCVAQDLRRGGQRRACLSAPRHPHLCHFTPTQGSWLNQVAWWLSVLARRCLTRGDCCSAPDVATRLGDSLEISNTHQAHPYRWT
jgi:hypothetical protein